MLIFLQRPETSNRGLPFGPQPYFCCTPSVRAHCSRGSLSIWFFHDKSHFVDRMRFLWKRTGVRFQNYVQWPSLVVGDSEGGSKILVLFPSTKIGIWEQPYTRHTCPKLTAEIRKFRPWLNVRSLQTLTRQDSGDCVEILRQLDFARCLCATCRLSWVCVSTTQCLWGLLHWFESLSLARNLLSQEDICLGGVWWQTIWILWSLTPFFSHHLEFSWRSRKRPSVLSMSKFKEFPFAFGDRRGLDVFLLSWGSTTVKS